MRGAAWPAQQTRPVARFATAVAWHSPHRIRMMDWWWAYLLLGALIGFFAGMLGIGGGFAVVPVLALIFAAKGFPADYILHIAIATCMASIIFTSASSVISHHRHSAVRWEVVRGMTPGIIAGSLGGALLVGQVNVKLLAILFTAFAYFAATSMLIRRKPMPSGKLPGGAGLSMAGAIIGGLSSLAAIAGASLTVPFLVKRNVGVHQAIASAAAVGWPLAAAGTAGYIIAGLAKSGLPQYTLGFVYLPALLFLVIGSMATAPLGVHVAHRTSGALLRTIFAVLLYILATRMLLGLI